MAHLEDAGAGSACEPDCVTNIEHRSLGEKLRSRHVSRFVPTLFWLLVLLAWEAAARANLILRLFFPAPSVILSTLVRLTISGKLVVDLGWTLYRLSLGLALGGSLGLVLGLLMGWSRAARTLAEPVIAAVHPMPKLALLPLALIIFGIGESSKVVLIALTAFFPILINSMAGVQHIDALIWEVAHHYQARGWALLQRVIWPASLPLVLVGIRLAVNAALLMTVTVELVTARQGLGATIWMAWQTLRTAEMYVTLIIIAAIGLVGNFVLNHITRLLTPWQRKDVEYEEPLASI
jgi:NitT/TauT family transport system permease protein